MASRTPTGFRQLAAGLRLLVVLTVLLGLAYPLVMTGLAQGLFAGNADGSLVTWHGRVVGSDLVGQRFTTAAGRPDPRWFQGRPSAGGDDPLATGASNLALDNPVLVRQERVRRAAAAARDGVLPARVPPDAMTASGSGIDPDISPAYALEQVPRVARARGLPVAAVRALVHRYTQGRTLGFLGEPRVDVLRLNLALDRMGR